MFICSCLCLQVHEITFLQTFVKTKFTRNFNSHTKNEAIRIIRKNSATIPINATTPINVTGSTKPTSLIKSTNVIEFSSFIESINAIGITKTF